MNRVSVFRGSTSYDSCSTPNASLDSGALGTLLWIGDADQREFRAPRQYCLDEAPQVAIRHSLQDALRRPAGAVRGIVIAQPTRQLVADEVIVQLRLLYPKAAIANLMGAACEGMHAKVLQPSLDRDARFYGHQWNQFLPSWLKQCGAAMPELGPACHSVAVVSSSMAAAETMMELAESAGTTAVWCRNESPSHLRRVEAVWWDDSAARPTTEGRWRKRLQRFASCDFEPQHAWIANLPRPDQQQNAEAAGVSLVLSKPYRSDVLLNMLNASVAVDSPSVAHRRAA